MAGRILRCLDLLASQCTAPTCPAHPDPLPSPPGIVTLFLNQIPESRKETIGEYRAESATGNLCQPTTPT